MSGLPPSEDKTKSSLGTFDADSAWSGASPWGDASAALAPTFVAPSDPLGGSTFASIGLSDLGLGSGAGGFADSAFGMPPGVSASSVFGSDDANSDALRALTDSFANINFNAPSSGGVAASAPAAAAAPVANAPLRLASAADIAASAASATALATAAYNTRKQDPADAASGAAGAAGGAAGAAGSTARSRRAPPPRWFIPLPRRSYALATVSELSIVMRTMLAYVERFDPLSNDYYRRVMRARSGRTNTDRMVSPIAEKEDRKTTAAAAAATLDAAAAAVGTAAGAAGNGATGEDNIQDRVLFEGTDDIQAAIDAALLSPVATASSATAGAGEGELDSDKTAAAAAAGDEPRMRALGRITKTSLRAPRRLLSLSGSAPTPADPAAAAAYGAEAAELPASQMNLLSRLHVPYLIEEGFARLIAIEDLDNIVASLPPLPPAEVTQSEAEEEAARANGVKTLAELRSLRAALLESRTREVAQLINAIDLQYPLQASADACNLVAQALQQAQVSGQAPPAIALEPLLTAYQALVVQQQASADPVSVEDAATCAVLDTEERTNLAAYFNNTLAYDLVVVPKGQLLLMRALVLAGTPTCYRILGVILNRLYDVAKAVDIHADKMGKVLTAALVSAPLPVFLRSCTQIADAVAAAFNSGTLTELLQTSVAVAVITAVLTRGFALKQQLTELEGTRVAATQQLQMASHRRDAIKARATALIERAEALLTALASPDTAAPELFVPLGAPPLTAAQVADLSAMPTAKKAERLDLLSKQATAGSIHGAEILKAAAAEITAIEAHIATISANATAVAGVIAQWEITFLKRFMTAFAATYARVAQQARDAAAAAAAAAASEGGDAASEKAKEAAAAAASTEADGAAFGAWIGGLFAGLRREKGSVYWTRWWRGEENTPSELAAEAEADAAEADADDAAAAAAAAADADADAATDEPATATAGGAAGDGEDSNPESPAAATTASGSGKTVGKKDTSTPAATKPVSRRVAGYAAAMKDLHLTVPPPPVLRPKQLAATAAAARAAASGLATDKEGVPRVVASHLVPGVFAPPRKRAAAAKKCVSCHATVEHLWELWTALYLHITATPELTETHQWMASALAPLVRAELNVFIGRAASCIFFPSAHAPFPRSAQEALALPLSLRLLASKCLEPGVVDGIVEKLEKVLAEAPVPGAIVVERALAHRGGHHHHGHGHGHGGHPATHGHAHGHGHGHGHGAHGHYHGQNQGQNQGQGQARSYSTTGGHAQRTDYAQSTGSSGRSAIAAVSAAAAPQTRGASYASAVRGAGAGSAAGSTGGPADGAAQQQGQGQGAGGMRRAYVTSPNGAAHARAVPGSTQVQGASQQHQQHQQQGGFYPPRQAQFGPGGPMMMPPPHFAPPPHMMMGPGRAGMPPVPFMGFPPGMMPPPPHFHPHAHPHAHGHPGFGPGMMPGAGFPQGHMPPPHMAHGEIPQQQQQGAPAAGQRGVIAMPPGVGPQQQQQQQQ